jgi:hypothetical protein
MNTLCTILLSLILLSTTAMLVPWFVWRFTAYRRRQ